MLSHHSFYSVSSIWRHMDSFFFFQIYAGTRLNDSKAVHFGTFIKKIRLSISIKHNSYSEIWIQHRKLAYNYLKCRGFIATRMHTSSAYCTTAASSNPCMVDRNFVYSCCVKYRLFFFYPIALFVLARRSSLTLISACRCSR